MKIIQCLGEGTPEKGMWNSSEYSNEPVDKPGLEPRLCGPSTFLLWIQGFPASSVPAMPTSYLKSISIREWLCLTSQRAFSIGQICIQLSVMKSHRSSASLNVKWTLVMGEINYRVTYRKSPVLLYQKEDLTQYHQLCHPRAAILGSIDTSLLVSYLINTKSIVL